MKLVKRLWPIAVIVLIFAVIVPIVFASGYNNPVGLNIEEADLSEKAYISGSSGASSAFDDNSFTSWVVTKSNEEAIIEFDSPTTVNSMMMDETGFNVKKFSIYSKENDKWNLIYRSNEMGIHKLVTFYPVTTTALKVVIDEKINTARINNIDIHNLKKTNRDDFRVTTYITPGSLSDYDPETNSSSSIKPDIFDVITDVQFIAYGRFDENGNIIPEENADLYLTYLKNMIGERDVNIFLTIFHSGNPADLYLNNPDNAIKSVVEVLNKTNTGGVDFDWEYPRNKREYDIYSDYIVKLKRELKKYDKQLSLALSPWGLQFSEEAIDSIDQVQLMAYDMFDHNGDNNSYQGSGDNAVEYLISCGFKKEQINLGMSFYGRPTDGSGVWIDYKDPSIPKDPYIMLVNNVWFNTITTVRDKTVYALHKNIGGLMIFSQNEDLDMVDPLSLTGQIGKALKEFN